MIEIYRNVNSKLASARKKYTKKECEREELPGMANGESNTRFM